MKKLVVITGASSGIGAQVAKTMAEKGHPLLLLARRLEPMEALHIPNAVCKSVDVTNVMAVTEAIHQAEKAYGPVDLLVNCAGIMLLGHPQEQSYQEWDAMVDVNIKGVLAGIQAVLHQMMERNGGTIINISSTAGKKTYENHAVYCGTKFAVHAITENMRQEVAGSNVRFITVAPGMVNTPLVMNTTNAAIKQDYLSGKDEVGGGLNPLTIAQCISFAYEQPQDVCVREIVVAQTRQAD